VGAAINVSFDTSGLDKTVARYQKNLAYSTAQALRASVLEAQRRIRESLRRSFHLRRVDFMNRSIKIFAFPSVASNRPYAEIGIDNKARLILSLFEDGGARTPFVGHNVAIPILGTTRPSAESAVREDLTFQALHFQRGPITARGRSVLAARRLKGIRKRKLGGQYYVWQGAQRTFILSRTARAPLGGVFQRVGPKRDDIRLLYAFKSTVQVKAVLEFANQTEQAFADVFREAFFTAFYRL
jgi:hypothetical protein